MKAIIIMFSTILVTSCCKEQGQIDLVDASSTNTPFYGALNHNVAVDVRGRLLFSCEKCPNKFCKHMACEVSEKGNYKFNCECKENEK